MRRRTQNAELQRRNYPAGARESLDQTHGKGVSVDVLFMEDEEEVVDHLLPLCVALEVAV